MSEKTLSQTCRGGVSGDRRATWDEEGYYLIENGEHNWGFVTKAITMAAHKEGLIPSIEIDTIT